MDRQVFSIPASSRLFFFFGARILCPSISVDRAIFCEKKVHSRVFIASIFWGLLFFSAATNFATVILNVNTERGEGRRGCRTAYGYRDRLRIGKNSNISRDNISSGPIENCKCFHRPDKIVVHSRAPGYFYSARSLSFLIDIVKSNAIFISFAAVAFVCSYAAAATRWYNYRLVKP